MNSSSLATSTSWSARSIACAERRDWPGLVRLRDRMPGGPDVAGPPAVAGGHAGRVPAGARRSPAVRGPGGRPAVGRFTLGPLSEVAASTHSWADLAPAPRRWTADRRRRPRAGRAGRGPGRATLRVPEAGRLRPLPLVLSSRGSRRRTPLPPTRRIGSTLRCRSCRSYLPTELPAAVSASSAVSGGGPGVVTLPTGRRLGHRVERSGLGRRRRRLGPRCGRRPRRAVRPGPHGGCRPGGRVGV